MYASLDLENLLSIEDTFYQQGLDSGQPHGELHGLFEGRALGREKCWELWEEVGYYEGAARLWKTVLIAQEKHKGRCARLPSPSHLGPKS